MTEQISNIIQIIFADIILSGDNALIIGMAASGLPQNLRKKAIFLGMALAAFFRNDRHFFRFSARLEPELI